MKYSYHIIYIIKYQYYRLIGESTKYAPNDLTTSFEKGIRNAQKYISSCKGVKFNNAKKALKARLIDIDSNLYDRSARVWSEIDGSTFEFYRVAELSKMLDNEEEINSQSVIAFYDTVFINNPLRLTLNNYGNSDLTLSNNKVEKYSLNKDFETYYSTDQKVLSKQEFIYSYIVKGGSKDNGNLRKNTISSE